MDKVKEFVEQLIAKIQDEGVRGAGWSDTERVNDVINMIDECHSKFIADQELRGKKCQR